MPLLKDSTANEAPTVPPEIRPTPLTGLDTSLGPGKYFAGKARHIADDPAIALRYISIVFAVFWIIDYVMMGLAPDYPDFNSVAFITFHIVGLLMSGVIFGLSRLSLSRQRMIIVGLVFEVAAALLVALPDLFMPAVTADTPVLGVSWVCLWVALFPMFVHGTLGQSILASILAASMAPLVYLVGTARGMPLLPFFKLLELYLPNYLAAAISIFPIYLRVKIERDLKRVERLGSYELVERLGEGGMGEVWRARHAFLARSAAIKFIKTAAAGARSPAENEAALKRFQLEAETTASLQSPHTVMLYDFGVAGANTFYYVMEHLEGIDLSTLVKRHGPQPAERVIHILRQACHSLKEAHARGLIHRDIKPANILLCRLGLDCDFVKVLDFGLVKRTAFDDAGVNITATALMVGTPSFMAPEMILGDRPIDARIDLYALGCVAYWLMCGRLVFESGTSMKMLDDHLHTPPTPPSRRTEIPVPPALETLVMACLEKNPDRRIATIAELETRLGAIETPSSWTRERAEKWWSAHGPAKSD